MKKILGFLIIVLSITELLVMLSFNYLPESFTNPWLKSLFDAVIVSIVAMLSTSYILKYCKKYYSIKNIEFLIIKSGVIVFIIESSYMLALYLINTSFPVWIEIFLDVLLIGVLTPVIIYASIIQPEISQNINTTSKTSKLKSGVWLTYLAIISSLSLLIMTNYKIQLKSFEKDFLTHEVHMIDLVNTQINEYLYHSKLDLLMLANHSNATDNKYLKHIHSNYLSLLKIKNHYTQIRHIDASGNEIIRVERINNKIIVSKKLQNKSNRYYFHNTKNLKPGDIYISPLDLNIENNKVVKPYQPVIRLSTPIYTNNKFNGVIIINLDGTNILNFLKKLSAFSHGEPMLINNNGYWLFGGKPEYQWMFMFPEKKQSTVDIVHPELWEKINESNLGLLKTSINQFIYKNLSSKNKLLSSTNTNINRQKLSENIPSWYIVLSYPHNYTEKQLSDTRYFLIVFIILVTLTLALACNAFLKALIKKYNAEQIIERMAMFDSLTNVANRALFKQKMNEEMERFFREDIKFSLMYLDLDKFKPINDTYGHHAGDNVLKEISKRLVDSVRTLDIVARLGGDEFAILIHHTDNISDLKIIAQRIIDSLTKPIVVNNKVISLGVSIGITSITKFDKSIDTIIARADSAMYASKKLGGNCYELSQ